MAEENQDANLGAESSATPSPESNQDQTPEGAQPSSGNENGQERETNEQVPFHEHPRWKQLLAERNEDRRKLAELQSQLASKVNEREEVNLGDKYAQKFKGAGVDEKSAKLLAETGVEIAREVAESRLAPVEAAQIQREIDNQLNDFAKAHEDYNELQPRMYEVFKALPERVQDALASNPRLGAQFLYDHVKQLSVEEDTHKAFKKGVQEGYQAKKSKEAASPKTGASVKTPGKAFTDEEIASMDMKTYLANKSAIFASRGMRA